MGERYCSVRGEKTCHRLRRSCRRHRRSGVRLPCSAAGRVPVHYGASGTAGRRGFRSLPVIIGRCGSAMGRPAGAGDRTGGDGDADDDVSRAFDEVHMVAARIPGARRAVRGAGALQDGPVSRLRSSRRRPARGAGRRRKNRDLEMIRCVYRRRSAAPHRRNAAATGWWRSGRAVAGPVSVSLPYRSSASLSSPEPRRAALHRSPFEPTRMNRLPRNRPLLWTASPAGDR